MNTPPPPSLDPVSALTALMAYLFGMEVAGYGGPYAVMLLGSFTGSLIALHRRDPTPRMNAFAFIFILMALSMAVSIPASNWIAAKAGQDWRWAVFPVSMLIAAIGESWLEIGKWAAGLFKAVVERRSQGGGPPT